MIKSFKHKGLELFFIKNTKKGINADHSNKIKHILDILNIATSIKDIDIPKFYLHILNPKNNKIYSVSVSGNWRITFKIIDKNVYDVNYLDYH